jgi:hypothetical protein
MVVVLVAVWVAGCGGGGDNAALPSSQPMAVVFLDPPPATLAVNAAATVAAVATFPSGAMGGNMAVTWTLACGSAGACGTLGASDDAGGVTYTAPAAIPAAKTVTLTATSVADTRLSVAATVTITAPIPIVVSFDQAPPASIQVGGQFALTAAVENDVAPNPEVTWTVACAAAVCGSFQPVTTMSGSATTYSAPTAIPAGGSVRVTATSVTDASKSAATTIVVTAAAPTLANGTYVFQIAAPPGNQASFVTGVLVANAGHITAGEQDSIAYSTDADGNAYANTEFQPITGGSYATSADGNLQVSIALGPDSTETFTGTLGGGARGFIAGIDGASVTGTLELQSSIAAPLGGYAISLFGGDESQYPLWLAGVVNIDRPGAISGSGSILDVNDGSGQQTGTYTLGGSSVSVPDSQGRVQIQLQPAGPELPPMTLIAYIVDATHLRLILGGDTGDLSTFQGVLGGVALGQGAGGGQFNAASLSGTSYVFGAQGQDAGGSLQLAGIFTLNANGAVTGMLNWNDLSGKATQAPLPLTGTYAVEPTGRVTLTGLTDGKTFSHSLHAYLAAGGNALLLSNDANDSFDGQGFQQQAGAFTAKSFSGTYGLNLTQFSTNAAASGLQQSSALGTLSAAAGATASTANGFADAGNGGADVAIGGTVTVQNDGIFQAALTGLDPGSPRTVGSFTLYAVDGTHSVLIETDANALSLGTLQMGATP